VQKDVKEVSTRMLPILDNAEYVTSRMKSIAENIDDQVLTVRDSIASVREIADNVVELERRIQERIEGPILESISFVAALIRGFRTFVDRLRT
jgi:methyl-accepting chemotaxis protein